ncbi:hypothetical protein PsYK624_066980 [Phanerochaete sordida]|uniref:F-box domain-containing protein n=1 Tax=Phanerochaete sordida TaxID=48140 RepID=A0A9P3G994_9APHY|nr:hypothetical protein PsYK624_066980 [Phanerochaete sordida]
MDPSTAERLLEEFNASVAHVWSPSSPFFSSIHDAANSQDVTALCDAELARLARMTEKVRSALGYASVRVATLRNRSKCRLPADVLLLIFRACADLGSAHERLRTTVALSQTCAHWRALALAHPLLWTDLDFSCTPEPLARLFLARSAPCALRTTWPASLYATPRACWAAELCAAHLPRMTELALVATRAQLLPWAIDAPAPALERAFLQDADAFAYAPLVLERALFAGAPRLRALHLVGLRLPWAPGAYAGLRELRIQRCNVGAAAPADSDLLALFRDAPELEVLVLGLRSTLNWDGAGDALLVHAQDAERIALPRLRHFTLEMPVPYARHILAGITLPPALETLKLCLEAPHAAPSTVPTLLDPDLLPPALFTPTTRLEVRDCASHGGVALRGFTSAEDTPRWEYGWKHRSRTAARTLEGVASMLAARYTLPHTRALALLAEDGNCQDVGDALPLLGALPPIRTLRTQTWCTRTVVALGAPGHAALCEELEEIYLVVAACEPSLAAVLDALRGVAAAASGMRTLDVTFRATAFSEGDAELVRKTVRVLKGQGVEISCRRVTPYQVCGSADMGEDFAAC